MKIQGKNKVTILLKGTYKQPYPVAKNTYSVNGRDADLVFVTDQVQLDVDGVYLEGYCLYILFNPNKIAPSNKRKGTTDG